MMGKVVTYQFIFMVLHMTRADGRLKLHNKNNKKYIIEVQDHQQAMKGANPLVDLEDTVRRGINDPLADPRFVMNKINDDFFGTPSDNTLHNNNELMAYQGRDKFLSSMLGVNGHALNGRTPSNPIQQHATKEEIVARHPASVPFIQDFGIPRYQSAFSSLHHTQNIRTPLTSLEGASITANIAQNVAGGLSRGLPGSVAAFASNGKLAQFGRGTPLGTIHSQMSVNERALPLSRINKIRNKMFSRRQPMRIQHNSYFHNQDRHNKLNSLTGLPDDLEDRTYGAVSSISSVAETSSSLPSSITVSTADAAEGKETQNSEEQQDVSAQEDAKEEPTSDTSSDKSPSIGSNFSSLKAFLEADNELREKLATDGLETLDSSKKLESAYNSLYTNAKRSLKKNKKRNNRFVKRSSK